MFERYSEKARRVIFFARYEASQFGSPLIEPHHLLLGLLRESWDVVEPFLKSRDRGLAIFKEIEQRFSRQAPIATSVDLPLSHESKRVLAYAAEEAERLRHRHIGALHLLLGLLREQGSVAAEILRRHGLELDALREASAGPEPGLSRTAMEQAAEILRRRGLDLDAPCQAAEGPPPGLSQTMAEMQHAVAAVLALPAGRLDAAWRILEALGKEKVRVEVTTPEDSFTVSFGEEHGPPAA
jgi:ATP-dependent Clp protease ATP-binding subunit ClpA